MVLTQQSALIARALREDPEYFMRTAVENNPGHIAANLQNYYGILPNQDNWMDMMAAFETVLQANTGDAKFILEQTLNAPVITGNLTEPAQHAIFSSPQAQIKLGIQPSAIEPSDYGINPGYGLPSGWNGSTGGYGLPDGWNQSEQSGGNTLNWADFIPQMLPGILDLFGLGQGGGGSQPQQPNQPIIQGPAPEADNSQKYLTWGLAILAVIIIIVLLVKTMKK